MFMTLYRDFTRREEQHREELIRSAAQPVANAASRFPYDEVRDWVQAHHNYFDTLDRAAEQLFDAHHFDSATLRDDFSRYLLDVHDISIGSGAALLGEGTFWRLNRAEKQLVLAEDSSLESKMFWMAHVIGLLDQRHRIEREVRQARFSTEEAQGLARIALANYFAGALMMPYRKFNEYAQAVRYDLERLQYNFGTSFEQVCHRLSTMQRRDMRGIPFYFAKTDIAGNILKRSSATAFQFAQFGGPCPVWNVYRAFARPGEILVQLAITPDQTRYLNIARTVGRGGGSYLSRPRSVAVVLGCELRHAAQTVYAAGLDLNNPAAADPIGPGCRACERDNCRHRSVPPVGRILDVGTAERGVVPYRLESI
jgi:predicted transcriptional regulator